MSRMTAQRAIALAARQIEQTLAALNGAKRPAVAPASAPRGFVDYLLRAIAQNRSNGNVF